MLKRKLRKGTTWSVQIYTYKLIIIEEDNFTVTNITHHLFIFTSSFYFVFEFTNYTFIFILGLGSLLHWRIDIGILVGLGRLWVWECFVHGGVCVEGRVEREELVLFLFIGVGRLQWDWDGRHAPS